MLKKVILFSFLFILLSAFAIPFAANAQTSIINPGTRAYTTGDYTLNDILLVVIGASRWILGIVGSLALLMFIYGGFTFLISAGSSDKISQAKKILVAAVVGLIIVFSSYLIIQFVLSSLGLNWKGDNSQLRAEISACEAQFGAEGYSCMSDSIGKNCKAGLCLNGSDKADTSIECCTAN